MAGDDGDILGSKTRDDGDILGISNTCENSTKDEMVAPKPPPREGIFAGLDTASLSEEQLAGLLEVMAMNVDLPSVKKIMLEGGSPRLPKTSVVPAMVSEACKVYLRELVQLSVVDGIDFVLGDSILSKKYRL